MDRQNYWQEIADKADTLIDEFPLVVSLNTRNGGKAGSIAEVDRHTAGKLLVDGTHILATDEQASDWRQARALRIEDAKREAAARRLQVEVIERNLTGLSTMTAAPPFSKKSKD